MALVNPNIAMSFRQPEFTPRNALAEYAQIQQIQGGQQAQQLNALKMQEAQAALEERNALRQLNPSAEDYENQLFRVNPQLGIQYRKEAATTAAQRAAQQKSEFELKAAQRKFGDDLKRGLSANPSDANIIAFGEDAVLQGLYTPDQVKATVSQLLALPAPERVRILSQAGATAGELKPTVQSVNRSGQTDLVRVPAFSGAPTTVGTFADVPLPAAVEAQKTRVALAGKPVTTITNVQEKAEAGAYGKMLVDQYNDISKAAGLAVRTLPAIQANLGALNAGLDTGFGTDAKKAGARVLGALGVQDAEKFATTAEVFQANAINAVLQKQLEQKGPQTESDSRRIEQVGAELAKTKGANEFILSLAKEQLQRDVEQRNFYDSHRKRTGSFNGAEDAWFSGEGGRSLFDRPALKKFAPGTAAQGAAAQIPTGRAAPAPTAAPAAAPIYARNPQTNQRIMSTDGGNTWTPAR
jgi:hypothetical protein